MFDGLSEAAKNFLWVLMIPPLVSSEANCIFRVSFMSYVAWVLNGCFMFGFPCLDEFDALLFKAEALMSA